MYLSLSHECIIFSIVSAAYGATRSIPQISFASPANDLSNKDIFPYFARTCPDNRGHAESLNEFLKAVNIRNVAICVGGSGDDVIEISSLFSTL